MIVERLPDWRARFDAAIAAARRRRFAWGRHDAGHHDCTTFVNGVVEAMTGRDLLERLGIARYHTAEGATEALRRFGQGSMAEALASVLPPIPVAAAGIGDVAVVEGRYGEALAIVGGAHLLAATERGLGALPLTAAIGAVRV